MVLMMDCEYVTENCDGGKKAHRMDSQRKMYILNYIVNSNYTKHISHFVIILIILTFV